MAQALLPVLLHFVARKDGVISVWPTIQERSLAFVRRQRKTDRCVIQSFLDNLWVAARSNGNVSLLQGTLGRKKE